MIVLLGAATACKPGGLTSDDESSTSSGTSTDDGGSGTSEDESSSESTETGDEVPPCEPPMLDSCWSEVTGEVSTCVEACSCEDIDCTRSCHEALKEDYWGCVDQHCPEPWSDTCSECYSTLACEEVCDAQRDGCLADGCDSNMCNYQRLSCASGCWSCINLYFEFAWADSCELVLPGPPLGIGVPYVSIDIGGQGWPFTGEVLPCGDPVAGDVVWADENLDRLLLCDVACETFAASGVAEVQYGCPPG